jgi:hypothetical protein
MKEKKTFRFGKKAQAILLFALPVMIIFSFGLTLYIAHLDSITFLDQRDSILLILETFSRIFVCLALGTILSDYAEKKTLPDA